MQNEKKTSGVALFQCNFKELITPDIMGVMYGLFMVLLLLGIVASLVAVFLSPQLLMLQKIGCTLIVVIAAFFLLVCQRVAMELIMVLFRIEKNTRPHQIELELNPDAEPFKMVADANPFVAVSREEAGSAGAISQSLATKPVATPPT